MVNVLRKNHPNTPLLIMSKTRYASATEWSKAYVLPISNRNFQKNMVINRRTNGDNNIYFLVGSIVLGDDYYECTLDGSHPSDLGSYRIGEALLIKINEIL